MNILYFVALYLTVINLTGFAVMGIDKRKAVRAMLSLYSEYGLVSPALMMFPL